MMLKLPGGIWIAVSRMADKRKGDEHGPRDGD
jgi:hypothetical protein